MKPIPADIAEQTWQRVASLSPRRAAGCLAYLLAVDHDLPNNDERQLLLYLGASFLQITAQGARPLPTNTEDQLDAAEAENFKWQNIFRVKQRKAS
jgi:hypothetical protein